MRRAHWLAALGGLVALHVTVRVPLLTEGPWHTDEGIGCFCLTQQMLEVPPVARADFLPPLHLIALSAWGDALSWAGWRSSLPREGFAWETEPIQRLQWARLASDGGDDIVLAGGMTPEAWEQWSMPPLWAIRLSTLIAAVGVLLITAHLARWMTGSAAVALAAGFLLAAAPHVARWDTLVRYQTPLTVPILGAAAVLWAIASADEQRRRPWAFVALGAMTLVALLTHHLAAFVLPPLGLWLALVRGRRGWRRTALAAVAMIAALAVFLILWGSALREQWQRVHVTESTPAALRNPVDYLALQPALPLRILTDVHGQTMAGELVSPVWRWSLMGLLGLGAVGYLIRLARRRGSRVDGLLLLWLFGPAALVTVLDLLRPGTAALTWRHFIPCAPASAMLFALGLAQLKVEIRPRVRT